MQGLTAHAGARRLRPRTRSNPLRQLLHNLLDQCRKRFAVLLDVVRGDVHGKPVSSGLCGVQAGLVQPARTLLGPAARDHDAEKLLLKTKLDKVPQSQILLHLTVLVGGMMGQFSIH